MGYASEYDVERYMRESLIPRIAPVSRVNKIGHSLFTYSAKFYQEMIMNYVAEKALGLPRSY